MIDNLAGYVLYILLSKWMKVYSNMALQSMYLQLFIFKVL